MKCVVLLSGGIDSTVLLASRLAVGDECIAVFFDYVQPQRRKEELAAIAVADHYGVKLTSIYLGEVLRGHAIADSGAVVPARNLVMLATAAALSHDYGATAVAFGANKDDINGFPDCRPEFIDAIDNAIYYSPTTCQSALAPLVNLTKREIVKLGRELRVPFAITWSCYRGGDQSCGKCGACLLREAAMA